MPKPPTAVPPVHWPQTSARSVQRKPAAVPAIRWPGESAPTVHRPQQHSSALQAKAQGSSVSILRPMTQKLGVVQRAAAPLEVKEEKKNAIEQQAEKYRALAKTSRNMHGFQEVQVMFIRGLQVISANSELEVGGLVAALRKEMGGAFDGAYRVAGTPENAADKLNAVAKTPIILVGEAGVHAEQRLLQALAEYLRKYGDAALKGQRPVTIYGTKPPCSSCARALAKFQAALATAAYAVGLEFSGKVGQKNDDLGMASMADTAVGANDKWATFRTALRE